MKKFLAAFLCAATVLSLAGCKKEGSTPNNTPTTSAPTDSKIELSDAAEKTLSQTSFHMTGSYDTQSEVPTSSQTKYELLVNGYGTSAMEACGTVDKNGAIEKFSIEGDSYRYEEARTDGSISSGTKALGEAYLQCEALVYCDFIRTLLGNETVQTAAIASQAEGITTFTPTLTAEQFLDIYPMDMEAEIENLLISIRVSKDGYCTGVHLSFTCDGYDHVLQFQFHDFGKQQDCDSIAVTFISADNWKQAFSTASFENFTLTRYYDDRTKKNPSILMIQGPVSATTLSDQYTDSNGKTMQLTGMTYFYQFGNQSYRLEYGSVADPDGYTKGHYKLEPTGQYAGETPTGFAAFLEATFGLREQYDAYTYDAVSGTYTGTAADENWNYSNVVAFANGKLASIQSTVLDKQTNQVHTVTSYYFKDYGTTKIQIPSK